MKNLFILFVSALTVSTYSASSNAATATDVFKASCWVVTTGSSGSEVNILASDVTVNLKVGDHAVIFKSQRGLFEVFLSTANEHPDSPLRFTAVIADTKGVGQASTSLEVATIDALPRHFDLVGPNMSDLAGPRLTEMFCDRLP